MRIHCHEILHEEMKKNDKIILITPDLGYKFVDRIAADFPDRFINLYAAEQQALGVAIAYALSGYIPVVYSISSFLLKRGFEWIDNYMGEEGINVKLLGSGLEDDYKDAGYTHHLFKSKELCDWLEIESYFPNQDNFVDEFNKFLYSKEPGFLGLRK